MPSRALLTLLALCLLDLVAAIQTYMLLTLWFSLVSIGLWIALWQYNHSYLVLVVPILNETFLVEFADAGCDSLSGS